MSLLEVPLLDLAMVLPFRAEQDVRYYLNGILISPYNGGAMLVATNGHMLAAVESKESRVDKDRILDVPMLFGREIRDKAVVHPARTLTVDDENGHAVISDQHGEQYIKAGKPFIDGRFPEWQRVIPKVERLKPGLLAALNPQYIATLKRALPKHEQHKSVSFWHDETRPKENACVARINGIGNLIVVIMPMRDDAPTVWPEWMPREPPPKVEEPAPAPAESAA